MAIASRLNKLFVRPMSRDKTDMLTLLGACLLVLLPHFSHLPLGVSSAVMALVGWRAWVTMAGHRLPPRWLLVSIATLTMAGIWAAYRTFLGRDAGVAMLTLLLALKMLEMHHKRDLFVVVFLSFFVVLTNFFYSQSIFTALLMTAAVIGLLTAQQSFQYTGAVPSMAKRLRLSGLIFGMAVPLMLVLFFLFPRIQGPLWGMPRDANGAKTGLSDTMSPGSIASLAQSDEIAFRVKFYGPPPPRAALYWRAGVMTEFDGRTWNQSATAPLPPGDLRSAAEPGLVRYQVTQEPHGRHWLFTLEMPFALPQLAGNAVTMRDDFQLLATQPINSRIRFDVVSTTRYQLQPDANQAQLLPALAVPTGFNPATLAFARQLQLTSADPQQRVRSVLNYFRQQPFSYTLEPPILGRNGIDDFLFTTRAGFCEHYAAAFVVLMREMQIPARVVSGYQGGEINPVDGYLEIRQSDAHAWAEIWLAGRGWIRVDPTAAVAPERVERSALQHATRSLFGGLMTFSDNRTSAFGKLRLNWDAMSNSWNQWVLNYSPERQRNLISNLGLGNMDWPMLTLMMFAAAALVLAAMMIPLMLNRHPIDPALVLYRQFCRRMARRGIVAEPATGPRTFARMIDADTTLPEAKKIAAVRFLERYETVQYGTVGSHQRTAALIQLNSLLNACR